MTWKDAQSRVGWGTLMLFGVGVSLGSAMLATKAAGWLAKMIVALFGLQTMRLDSRGVCGLSHLHSPWVRQRHRLAVGHDPDHPHRFADGEDPASTGGLTMVLQYVVSYGYIL